MDLPHDDPTMGEDRQRQPDATMNEDRPRRRNLSGLRLERVEEVFACYLSPPTHAVLHRLLRTEPEATRPGLWRLFLDALEHGFLVQNRIQLAYSGPNLRLLFVNSPRSKGAGAPEFAQRYRLDNTEHRTFIADVVMPAAIEKRDLIIEHPEQLERVVANYLRRIRSRRATEIAIAKMPRGEQEIVMFGDRLWPAGPQDNHDYFQARAAVWYFNEQNRRNDRESIANRAIFIRYSIKWLWEFNQIRGRDPLRGEWNTVFSLIHRIVAAMEKNPAAKCNYPGEPKVELNWKT
jgi:hypothetical protein